MSLAEQIRAIPKVELHLHLEGSVQPQTLLELAERNRVELPCKTLEQVRPLFHYKNFRQFAEVIIMTGRCLKRPEDFALVVRRMAAELAGQNVQYAEVFWTPQLYLMGGLALSDVLAGLNEGRAAVLKQYGVQLRWMPDIVRSLPPPDDRVVAWLCGDEARRGGVVALGLGGPEAGHPPEKFQQVFDRARAAGVPANPHAGEAAGPESVWGALKALKAVRIGHGVRAIEDAALVKHLVERRIPLEVCPTSNLRLGIYPSYGEHPLKRLVEAGCVVTINSDDPVLFDTTLTDEYRHALQDCGLTLKQLEAAALNAVTRSYLPDDEKAAMLETCRTKWARLRGIEQKDAQEKRKN